MVLPVLLKKEIQKNKRISRKSLVVFQYLKKKEKKMQPVLLLFGF